MGPADDDDSKKPSVIHTRIPEALDHEIKKRASSLGLSVSNLVRNVLLNTFGLVEGVIADTTNIARHTQSGPAPAPAPVPSPASRILAWQDVTLNLNALCAHCNAILPKGTRAALAVTDAPAPASFRCPRCVQELA